MYDFLCIHYIFLFRYQDSRRRVESPSGANSRHVNFDKNQSSPFKSYDNRPVDTYVSPNRNAHKQNHYDSGHVGNLHNLHYFQSLHHHAHSVPLRDNKDPRMNGPRHVNNLHNPPIPVGTETESPEFRPSPEVLAELEEQFLYPLKKVSFYGVLHHVSVRPMEGIYVFIILFIKSYLSCFFTCSLKLQSRICCFRISSG